MPIHTKRLVCVVGPTAIGKTAVAIELAKHLNTVIISADSRQLFKELPIGTAQPSQEELKAVPHYFIANHSIHDIYSAGHYEKEVLALLEELFLKHDTIVVCGGTGLYIKALQEGLDSFPPTKPETRDLLNSYTLEQLQQKLLDVDPAYYTKVDLQNPQRMKRALEVFYSTGNPYSDYLNKKNTQRNFESITIGLTIDRELLYKRINQRVDQMITQGLLEEVKQVYPYKQLNALQTVGYTELFDYLDGNLQLPKALELIKQHTRNYAKRQLTWFKKDLAIKWFQPTELDKIIAYISILK